MFMTQFKEERMRTSDAKLKDEGIASLTVLEGNPDNPNNPKRNDLNQMILSKDFKNKYKTFDNDLVLIKQKQDNVEFAAMVESVDQSIGKIINELKKLKIEENTIIIFYSDNGGCQL